MKRLKASGAFAALAMLAAQPCAAADFNTTERGPAVTRTSAFAGLNVRVPMGRTPGAKPSARLQLTTAYTLQDLRTGSMKTYKAQGLELGTGALGKPAFYMSGQEISRKNVEKLKLGGTGNTVLYVVGGVVVVGVILLLAAGYEPA